MNTELYDALGVGKQASPEEIKKAFRKKAMECHPDKHAGDKDKEAEFKKINEAYSTLSDPDKRRNYDQFGTVDANAGMAPDISEILRGMFGGGGPDFSFMFGGEDFDFFGGGRNPVDVIEIPIDICEIYYGKNKKVEFELLDLCTKCGGTGAADPSFVIRCITCNGQGKVHQQIGPFMQIGGCPSCMGNGQTIKNGKICQGCKGNKTVYVKRSFELKLPKGVPNGHELKMEGKGSYDEKIKRHKDILFKFKYVIKPPYELLDDCNMQYTLNVGIEDVLAGFEKKVMFYNDDHIIKADVYVNPAKKIVLHGLGLPNIKKNKNGDMHLKLNIDYGENERLIKYNDVLRKMFKKGVAAPVPESGAKIVKLS